MNRELLRLVALFACMGPAVSAQGQDTESSVFRQPTRLTELVSTAEGRPAVLADGRRIDSANASAAIAAVEITAADGNPERGIGISLASEDSSDLIYLDIAQAQHLRSELARFGGPFALDAGCSGLCVHGIARCSPSRAATQAICPAVYSASEGEAGVYLSTPRNAFRFPSVDGDAFAAAVEAALAAASGNLDR